MLLSERAQRNAAAIESSFQSSAQRSRLFIKHDPFYYFFILPLGPAPGGEGGASPAGTEGSWRGGSTGAGASASSATMGAGGTWRVQVATRKLKQPRHAFPDHSLRGGN